MLVDSGGTASATTVSSGGSETVSTGGTDLGAQISGGTQVDFGLASGATIVSWRHANSWIPAARAASDHDDLGGGAQLVGNYDGGLGIGRPAPRSRAAAPRSSEPHPPGGAATSTTILSGGEQWVGAPLGGTATDTTISNGGTQFVGVGGSGAATSTTILSGGTQFVGDINSGTATNTTILSGGEQLIGRLASGTATSTTISSGGTQVVGYFTGGTASSTTILSGGTEIISSGSIDSGAQISGGTQLDYGVANGATVFTGSQVVEFWRNGERHNDQRRHRICVGWGHSARSRFWQHIRHIGLRAAAGTERYNFRLASWRRHRLREHVGHQRRH